jgi:Putative phage abortive infection protein
VVDSVQRNQSKNWIFFAALCGLFLLGATLVASTFLFAYNNVAKAKELGPWADFFGGFLGPILTFVTFIGVLITIALQKSELNLTRQEMVRSADALETQIEAIKRQNFEATFFQMLTLHNAIVNSIDLVNANGQRIQGRDCFRTFYTRLTKIYRANEQKAKGKHSDKEILKLSYEQFWKDAQLELAHYFRYLFNIIRFLDESSHSKEYYIKLIRAQLSDQDLLLLFYNCLSPQGSKFKAYAEKYALFDNMPVIRLLGSEHKNRVAESAFGGSPRNAI